MFNKRSPMVTFDPSYPTHFLERVRRYKLRQCNDRRSKLNKCQLMMQTTSVEICWHQGREKGGKDVDIVWLCGECVVTPII